MWWIWLIVAAVVIVAIVIAVIVIKSKKNKAPGLDQIERGFKRYEAHVAKRTEELDGKISESTEKLKKINGQVAKVAADRKNDHEKISAASSWSDLDDVARDIEKRR